MRRGRRVLLDDATVAPPRRMHRGCTMQSSRARAAVLRGILPQILLAYPALNEERDAFGARARHYVLASALFVRAQFRLVTASKRDLAFTATMAVAIRLSGLKGCAELEPRPSHHWAQSPSVVPRECAVVIGEFRRGI